MSKKCSRPAAKHDERGWMRSVPNAPKTTLENMNVTTKALHEVSQALPKDLIGPWSKEDYFRSAG